MTGADRKQIMPTRTEIAPRGAVTNSSITMKAQVKRVARDRRRVLQGGVLILDRSCHDGTNGHAMEGSSPPE